MQHQRLITIDLGSREASPCAARSDSAVAITVTYLLPVAAIVLGVLVLNEHITIVILAGIALILAGVALTQNRPKKAPAEVAR